jgi:hypothetical protein
MSIRRKSFCLFLAVFAVVGIGFLASPKLVSLDDPPPQETIIPGRNVNMVSGDTLPGGDPWLQRQNEPSIAVSSRNPLHLLAGANDYRTVDMPISEGELPGKQPTAMVGDAWLGVFTSYDGGESWTSTMLPGYPQDPSTNPLKGFRAAADPVVRSGPNGLFYFSGIAFNRDTNVGVVFVARFIDDNNKESGNTIRYIDTKIIAAGTATTFLDKPWIAVDQPRVPISNITIAGQTIPRHNVYIAYSAFSGSTTTLGDIMFARSNDCGTTWKSPIKISSGNYAHQGATIAIKPVVGEVLVAWRRFSASKRVPDAIFVAQSLSRGLSFQRPVQVASVAPFDQPTTDETQALPGTLAGTAFRTNSYPTMAADKSGHVYLAWSQRGLGPAGDARVVLSASFFGSNWSAPQPVANVGENGLPFLGHQLMPSLAFAGGKLVLIWVDERYDVSGTDYGFSNWIIDDRPYRHTMDIWAAEADTSKFPALVWRSRQVSRYLYSVLQDESGEVVFKDRFPVIFPVQFNCVNYPLFKGGHNPFMGDYIDIAAAPSFRQDTWRNWIFNTEQIGPPVFHAAWTDNRDVRPPLNGDWTTYTPPSSQQDAAYVSPEHPSCNPLGSGNEPGMRNQNIYTSRITWGIEAAVPVNDKLLDLADGVARAFVVYVKNNTNSLRSFRLTIAAQPAGGQASFEQFDLLTTLDVDISAFSTIARTVFIRSTDANAALTLDIAETDAAGYIIADGLSSSILINGDTSNPGMSGGQETHNPNIVNSANPNIVNWYVNPNIVNPNIVNPNIVNPNIRNYSIVNPNIVNPNIRNPNIVNPNIRNPNIVNPNIVNPNIVNPNIVNPNIVNPNIVNPNIVNPNIRNESLEDDAVTDVEWTVKNEGTTTTSYTLKALSKKSPPDGVYVQLLVYRVHYTPAVAGAELKAAGVDGCSLGEEPHHELILNIVNPNIRNPNIVNPNIVNPNIRNESIENATFSIPAGEEVIVDLRVLDDGQPMMALGNRSSGALGQATTVQEFIESLGFAVTSQAVNSVDVAMGYEIPPADSTDLVIGTSSLPDGVVNYPFDAPLSAYGGVGSYVWSLNAGELPPGLFLASGGSITGAPTQAGTWRFIVRVDSDGQFDTQEFTIFVDSDATPDPLNVTTTTLPNAVQGHWYGATLEAVGGYWPRSWGLSSGTMPNGVSIDGGGVISGTPTVAGSFNFTVRVVDRDGTIDTQALTLDVATETASHFVITGIVFDESGSPLGGVVLRGLPNTPVTAADGTYSDQVSAGWSGTATPFASGHSFMPESRTYTSVASSQSSQDYNTGSATLNISGTVTLSGGAPLAGVTMVGLPGNPSTDLAGAYSVTVSYGWSGTVTPVLANHTFAPASITYSNITLPQVTNYIGTPITLPAAKLVFTQNPGGGIGGAFWPVQPKVEVQDAAGNIITSDDSTVVTLVIEDNPGSGSLSGSFSMTVTDGVATFAGLSIDKGGWGYTLEAISVPSLTEGTSETFNIEGFSETKYPLENVMKWQTATPTGLAGTDVVLIAGGLSWDATHSLSDVCFYNPSTNEFEYPENSMNQARQQHTATSLLDGTVLFVGGDAGGQTAEIFDPATGDFTPISGTIYPHVAHRATLLQDGRVLVTGNMGSPRDSAEVYDPQTGTFEDAGPMNNARNRHTSTLLPNGKVLITGGHDGEGALNRAELYDPATGVFAEIAGGMAGGDRFNHQATLLDNGMVLLTGGDSSTSNMTAEIYDPTPTETYPNGHFQLIGNMLYGHERHQAALLRDGTVLIIGGNNSSASNEIYDPLTSEFRPTGPMSADRFDGASAVLTDGRVLITGGYGEEGEYGPGEVWNPLAPFPTHIISGTITSSGTDVGGITLVGLPGHPMTNHGGYYEGLVLDGWDGTVTPTKPGYTFNPPNIEYSAVSSNISGQDFAVTSAPGMPVKLAFAQQPSNTAAGATMTPAVTVEIQDAAGNLITTATNTVTLSLRNAGGATLSGDIDKAAVGGVATFDDLSINEVGTGYLLRANSDSLTEVDSSPFDITSAVGYPEINIEQTIPSGGDIPDGGSFDFGSAAVGSNTYALLTIRNLGTADLTITTPITITGTDSDQFFVEAQPTSPVGSSGSTTFEIRFSPTSGGAKSAAIVIYNNDSDENPYDIALSGTGTAVYAAPFTKIMIGAVVTDAGYSSGCAWGDYDNDGDLDLFVANGVNTAPGENNFLYTNNGDGTFTKVASGDVVEDPGHFIGCAWGDYDNDGDLDLFVANSGNNFLYTNNGDGTFTKVTSGAVVTDGGSS